jgi:hypothetical protein
LSQSNAKSTYRARILSGRGAGASGVLEYGAFVALALLLTWAALLVFLILGQLKTTPFSAASLFLALMVPFFWLSPEITELTISQFGSFKTNAQQATKYFDEIKQIRDKLRAQDAALTSSVEALDKRIAATTAKLVPILSLQH